MIVSLPLTGYPPHARIISRKRRARAAAGGREGERGAGAVGG